MLLRGVAWKLAVDPAACGGGALRLARPPDAALGGDRSEHSRRFRRKERAYRNVNDRGTVGISNAGSNRARKKRCGKEQASAKTPGHESSIAGCLKKD